MLSLDEIDGRDGGFIVSDISEGLKYDFIVNGSYSGLGNPDAFKFPIDKVYRFNADTITFPFNFGSMVRDGEGNYIEGVSDVEHQYSDGTYQVEFGTPLKMYVLGSGELTVRPNNTSTDDQSTTLVFDGASEIHLGARSPSTKPIGQITTTERPSDVMSAVSHLGASIKEHSPERSWPTLRGHPPSLEMGDTLSIPDHISIPDTGVNIEVPADYSHILPATSLAHYLGAELVPSDGGHPCLTTDTGFEYSLVGEKGFEETVNRTLQQVFLLDCATRTVGYYDGMTVMQAEQVSERVSFDYRDLYEADPGELLGEYLAVDYEDIQDIVPFWKTDAVVPESSESIPYIPYLSHHLSLVHTRSDGGGFVCSDGGESVASRLFKSSVNLDPNHLTDQIWVGDGGPPGSTVMLKEAYENRQSFGGPPNSLDVALICNDQQMSTEVELAEDAYNVRQPENTTVTEFRNSTVRELADAFQSGEYTFVHYVGHTTEQGFKCSDGYLDPSDLTDVKTPSFLLNSCNSSSLGKELVKKGSVGGVVTLSEMPSDESVHMGMKFAYILSHGYPLRMAYIVTAKQVQFGSLYQVVGDGTMQAKHREQSDNPTVFIVNHLEGDTYELAHVYTAPQLPGMGGIVKPHFDSIGEKHSITPNIVGPKEVDAKTLLRYLELDAGAILYNGSFSDMRDVCEELRDKHSLQ